jgi:hypothetical protein
LKLKDLISHTTKNILSPMLQETFDANLSKTAIDCFTAIQILLGGAGAGITHGLIQNVCQIGLDSIVMRDEILIQLCRQVTQNPKESPRNW